MQPELDHTLLKRSQQGDLSAYGQLIERYQKSVFNTCYRVMGTPQDAEDLAQDTFIRAYKRLHTFDLKKEFGPWVRTVGVNLCLNALQKKGNNQLAIDEQPENRKSKNAKTPEEILQQNEQANNIRRAIFELPAKHRAVIELRHYQAMSYAEIARTLKLPLSDVKSYLYRARQMLAQKLREYVYEK